jgi:hypothetical protein
LSRCTPVLLIGGVGGEGGVGFCDTTAAALSGLALAGAAAPSAPMAMAPLATSSVTPVNLRRAVWMAIIVSPRMVVVACGLRTVCG